MTLAALSFNIRDPGYSIELLSDAETPTSEVRQGCCSRRMGVKSQGPASATTGMVTAGEDERSENPNQGHPAPPGIGRFTSGK
jgi:hypothetical protein